MKADHTFSILQDVPFSFIYLLFYIDCEGKLMWIDFRPKFTTERMSDVIQTLVWSFQTSVIRQQCFLIVSVWTLLLTTLPVRTLFLFLHFLNWIVLQTVKVTSKTTISNTVVPLLCNTSIQGTRNLVPEKCSYNRCIRYLCWREPPIQGFNLHLGEMTAFTTCAF